jgi:hypothetical protein
VSGSLLTFTSEAVGQSWLPEVDGKRRNMRNTEGLRASYASRPDASDRCPVTSTLSATTAVSHYPVMDSARLALGRSPAMRRAAACNSTLDNGEDQSGWVVLVVQDAVDRGLVLVGGFADDVAAGVAIAVELREVAAGDFEPDAVSGQEDVGCCPQVKAELLRRAGQFRRAG